MTLDDLKVAGDAVSITTMLATLMQILPAVSAILTIVWMGLRIYEMDTVKEWLKKRKGKK